MCTCTCTVSPFICLPQQINSSGYPCNVLISSTDSYKDIVSSVTSSLKRKDPLGGGGGGGAGGGGLSENKMCLTVFWEVQLVLLFIIKIIFSLLHVCHQASFYDSLRLFQLQKGKVVSSLASSLLLQFYHKPQQY